MEIKCGICKKPLTKRCKFYFVEFWDVFYNTICSECIKLVRKHKKCRGEKNANWVKKQFGVKKYMIDMRKRNFVRWIVSNNPYLLSVNKGNTKFLMADKMLGGEQTITMVNLLRKT